MFCSENGATAREAQARSSGSRPRRIAHFKQPHEAMSPFENEATVSMVAHGSAVRPRARYCCLKHIIFEKLVTARHAVYPCKALAAWCACRPSQPCGEASQCVERSISRAADQPRGVAAVCSGCGASHPRDQGTQVQSFKKLHGGRLQLCAS